MKPDPLDPETIFGTFAVPAVVGSDGEVLESVSSTMDVARERLLAGAPDGYVVLAEHQEGGRGRDGAWECPPGQGLLMSVIMRVGLSAAQQTLVCILGAVAAAEALRQSGVRAEIKWPNDVVVATTAGGALALRKLGGVLVERVVLSDAAPPFVLGIGLNVNQRAEDLLPDATPPATSMHVEKGRIFSRVAVCREVFRHLDMWYKRLRMGQPERILARWRRLSCLLDRTVSVRTPEGVIRGDVVGLRSSGELIFEPETGGRMLLSDERARVLP